MNTTVLNIEGLNAGDAGRRVEACLRRLRGVDEVVIDIGIGQATIWHDPKSAPRNALEDAVLKAGYEVSAERHS